MFAHLLKSHGAAVEVLPHEAVTRARIGALEAQDVGLVCLSYLDINGSPAHLRFLVRRIRERLPGVSVIIGFWGADDPFLRNQAARQEVGADTYVSSLREALNACIEAARARVESEPGTAPASASARLRPAAAGPAPVGG
jgi:hypothetical protein